MATKGIHQRDVTKPYLFEVAWEVANKVGGIYTVLKTKSLVTAKEFGDRYLMIGPLNYKSAGTEVEQVAPEGVIGDVLKCMGDNGVRWYYGRWLIEGAPHVLLFDTGSISWKLNEWKADLWNVAKVPTPHSDIETNDAILLGYTVSWFLEEFARRNTTNSIIAHFHEWMGSVGVTLLRKRNIDIATIFTTHATLLGRYLCAGSVDFYNNLHMFNVDEEAGKRGIYHRYCIERAATHCCDVFTTVSHITAYEAEHLLKRKPDGVLPNGLNVKKFSAVHEFQNLHAINKEKLYDFVRAHFYGHLDFKLDNTLFFFTAGRYEYRNKGLDMFIESLARLNGRLRHHNSPMTVIAFIVSPASTHSFTAESLKGQAVVKLLHDTVNSIKSRIGNRIFDKAMRGEMAEADELLNEEDLVQLKRRIFALKRDALPPVVTHNMCDDSKDPVLDQIRRLHLFNHPDDRVKIVFHPEFINSNNPLFNLDYDDFVRGCHLGVFPSYYEPWGYTPAECTVMGIPSITTNLSGFGCYMDEMIENPSDYGIYIVDRRMKSVDESINQLADCMMKFIQKSRRQRINQRNRTERLSDILDWKRMGQEYVRARHLSLRRAYPHGNFPNDFDEPFDKITSSPSGSLTNLSGKIGRPISIPGSPRAKPSATEEVKRLLEGLNELELRERGTYFMVDEEEDRDSL